LSDRRLDNDLLGTVGARVVLHVTVWQRSTRSILAASILAADRAELAGQPKKPERQKQAPLEVDCSNVSVRVICERTEGLNPRHQRELFPEREQ
jgi:hypothetical protein